MTTSAWDYVMLGKPFNPDHCPGISED